MNDIKLLILDVDGTLTDGSIVYGDNSIEMKVFNVKDGLAIQFMSVIGIDVVILTGRQSEAVRRRAFELNCRLLDGITDKLSSLLELLEEYGVTFDQSAYIGDDLNDYAPMLRCGFKGCPADATFEIKNICDYVSLKNGGHGAVRDILEHVLKHIGKWDNLLKHYGVM